jgi:hypothetical protein
MFVSKSPHMAQQNPITDYLWNITFIFLDLLVICVNKGKGITHITMFTTIAHLNKMNKIMTVVITAEVLTSFKFKFYIVPKLRPIPQGVELKINNRTKILATEVFKFNLFLTFWNF